MDFSLNTGKAFVQLENGKLYIDGVLQSDIQDEYIYHEALVHPAMSHALARDRVLILGGAEGCTAREVLKWKDVKQLTQVDWDAELCNIFSTKSEWNNDSYYDNRMKLVIDDAWKFCKNGEHSSYNVIIIDLLDPQAEDLCNFSELLEYCKRMLIKGGSIVVNTGGIFPWNTFVHKEILKMLPGGVPYKIFVPSFEWEWSFVLLEEGNIGFFPSELKNNTLLFDLETGWPQMKSWTRDYF
jgi:spermidine synthase